MSKLKDLVARGTGYPITKMRFETNYLRQICSRYHEPPNLRVSTPQSRGLVRIKSYSTSPAENRPLSLLKVVFSSDPWTEICPPNQKEIRPDFLQRLFSLLGIVSENGSRARRIVVQATWRLSVPSVTNIYRIPGSRKTLLETKSGQTCSKKSENVA